MRVASFRRDYHLLQLFHTNFLVPFTFIYLFNHVPKNLYLLVLSFELLIHFSRWSTLHLICWISSRIKHHVSCPCTANSVWRPSEALISKVIVFAHRHLSNSHRHAVSFISIIVQELGFEIKQVSLHSLIHLSPFLSLLFLFFRFSFPFMLESTSLLFVFFILIWDDSS
jgi:hypothetical protein